MAKKVKAIVTLHLKAGKANPAPPVGPALAQHGVNLMQFCKDYNARTSDRMGEVIPAEITIFSDGSFKFILKSPPASELIKKFAGISSGASNSPGQIVGKLTRSQVKQIAEIKIQDMNAINIEGAMRMIEGTCVNMGVEVVD